MSSTITYKNVLEPSFQASMWQTCRLLIEAKEMEDLFQALGSFWIVQISGLVPIGEEIIQKEKFLSLYSNYIAALKQGEILLDSRLRNYFSSVLTVDLESLYAVKVNEQQSMVKIRKPVVQLQNHRFDYSSADGQFRSMVLGQDSIHWGLQFSYPHFYQDEKLEVFTVKEDAQFPNTTLFKNIQKWVRSNTIATPIEVEGKKVNVPIRLGKQCMSWINSHPQLKSKGLKIV
jgi:hypothetical protein